MNEKDTEFDLVKELEYLCKRYRAHTKWLDELRGDVDKLGRRVGRLEDWRELTRSDEDDVEPEPRRFEIGDKVSFVTNKGTPITGEVQELQHSTIRVADKEGYSWWVQRDSPTLIARKPMTCGECVMIGAATEWPYDKHPCCLLDAGLHQATDRCSNDNLRRAKLKEQMER